MAPTMPAGGVILEKSCEKARVVSQEQLAAQVFRLRLECPKISASARAGQFVMLRVREGNDPLLRRPFSFHRIHAGRGEIDILYRVTGRGTLILSRLGPGSEVSLVGPLGNGFKVPAGGPLALIAGGIGIAPLGELIVQAVSGGVPAQDVHLFYGARTASELLPESVVGEFGIPVHYSTDDGSFGYRGPVTGNFMDFTGPGGAENFRPAEIFSCGPLAMQYHVAKWALANDVSAQLSLESLMACGIGACLGCALPAAGPDRRGSGEPSGYVHVCEEDRKSVV
jgi:dihydroorotate dehydrogenase electron transfer subunit